MALALSSVDEDGLREALGDLGGHDLPRLVSALEEARAHAAGPVVLIAHTVKGWATSAAGHPENHGMLLPSEEVAAWGVEHGLGPDRFRVPAAGSPAQREDSGAPSKRESRRTGRRRRAERDGGGGPGTGGERRAGLAGVITR